MTETSVIQAPQLPDVFEDEDGTTYYATGHVDPNRFREAVIIYELTECQLTKDSLSVFDPDFAPRHVYFRDANDPANDELMIICKQSDEGAQPFTVASHD